MTTGNILTQVRQGMQVHTADGVTLGKIREIWYGTDPTERDPRCDEEVCSRLEVHHGVLHREVLYIPYNAIADVSGTQVTLNVDAATVREHPWHQRPRWIASGKTLGDDLAGVGPAAGGPTG